MAGDEILYMHDICKDYVMADSVLHVLKNITLTVRKGQFLAILGPSGSGKSTLMNIIGCLEPVAYPEQGDRVRVPVLPAPAAADGA